MPKVSIIVPVYNVEKYIKKCLDSLVNQTLQDIEIIVVNDGSPDNSQKIIDKYVKKYPKKVKSYIKENGGLGSARNYGIEKATSDYLMFVDSDDYIELNMAELLYDKVNKTNTDLAICGLFSVNEDYEIIDTSSFINNEICKNNLKYILFNNVSVWNRIYKKEIIIKNSLEFRSGIWYEDIDFVLKYLTLAQKVELVDVPLYNYLIRSGSIMNNKNILKNLDILLSFDEIIKFLKENNKFETYYNEVEFLAIYHIYICGLTRVININCDKKTKNKVIKEFNIYINKNFPKWKKNKYLNDLDKRKKTVYTFLNIKQYWLVSLLFKIKSYIKK